MSLKYKFWVKTAFWNGVRNSLAVFAGPVTVGLHEMGTADVWVMISGFSGMAGALISIWAIDNDHDGIIDLAQDKPTKK